MTPHPDSSHSHLFTVGNTYTRAAIYSLLSVPESEQGGDWATGYHQHGETFFIFCGVDTPGRTGHRYRNRFDGDELIWDAKNGSRLSNPQIQRLLAPGREVLVFFRRADRDPFTYAGRASVAAPPIDGIDGHPVSIRWKFTATDEPHPERPAEEVPDGTLFPEGAVQRVLVNRYERNPAARAACLAHHGCRCQVCEFDFEGTYGELGRGFIHVHHVKSLASIREGYEVDPINDLVPVCPNCHAMLHRRVPALAISDLKQVMRA